MFLENGNLDSSREESSSKCYVQPGYFEQQTTSSDITETISQIGPKMKLTMTNIFETNPRTSNFDTSQLHDDAANSSDTVRSTKIQEVDSNPSCHTKPTKLSFIYPRHFNRPINVMDHCIPRNDNVKTSVKTDEDELHKRKISACIRLLGANPLGIETQSNENFSKYMSSSSQLADQNSPHKIKTK